MLSLKPAAERPRSEKPRYRHRPQMLGPGHWWLVNDRTFPAMPQIWPAARPRHWWERRFEIDNMRW